MTSDKASSPEPATAAILLAAGRGVRAGGNRPKQWQSLAGKSVAEHALAVFAQHPRISRIVVVLHPDDIGTEAEALFPGAEVAAGGTDRAGSVRAGLALIDGAEDRVLIHDIARPLVTSDVIDRVLDALNATPAAAPALPVTDALWRGAEGRVAGVQSRDGLWRAQTPQGFHAKAIQAAHADHSGPAADDVEVARQAGLEVTIVPGSEDNMKITMPEDFERAERILHDRDPGLPDIRTGIGYDVHRFEDGDHVVLCGVRIPHAKGLSGHSDADVGMHAITDAIYGALADGDIGTHFPPTDPKWKGAASDTFLRHAIALVRTRGFRLTHSDLTLICEEPKIGPHADNMRHALARIMEVEADRISVKATTSERLGFTGRKEGISAMATVTLVGT